MMRFAALFLDSLTPADLDATLTHAHFDYLKQKADQITMAGGLRLPEGGGFCGSLWVIEAEDEVAARRLMDEDPYCLAGLRPNKMLYRWGAAPIVEPKGRKTNV
jgi:uncharacterized protein